MGVGGRRFFAAARRAQGLYYVATGVWPLVHMRSFVALTGPKHDGWLVKTVGLLLTVAGAAMIADDRPTSTSTRILGAGTAAALASVDVYYVARGRIRPIYLLDAAAEISLLGALGSGPALERLRARS